MSIRNHVQLIGRVATDLNLSNHEDKNYLNFLIVVNETYLNNEGEQVEKKVAVNVSASGVIAEHIVKHYTKGCQIAITGKLQNQEYEKNGEKKSVLKVIIQSTDILLRREPAKKEE